MLNWCQCCFSLAPGSKCEPYLHLWAAKQTTGKKRIGHNWSLEPCKRPLPAMYLQQLFHNQLRSVLASLFSVSIFVGSASIQRSKMQLGHQSNPLCCQHRNGGRNPSQRRKLFWRRIIIRQSLQVTLGFHMRAHVPYQFRSPLRCAAPTEQLGLSCFSSPDPYTLARHGQEVTGTG